MYAPCRCISLKKIRICQYAPSNVCIKQQPNNKTQLQKTLCKKKYQHSVIQSSHSYQVLELPVHTTIEPGTYIYIIPAHPEQELCVYAVRHPSSDLTSTHSHISISFVRIASILALSRILSFYRFAVSFAGAWLGFTVCMLFRFMPNRMPPFGQWYITKSVLRLQFFIVSQRSCLAWDTHRVVAVYISLPCG